MSKVFSNWIKYLFQIIIIPPKDEEALYKAMKYFIEHKDKVADMAANARPLIASRYEQKMVWETILKEYQSL